MMEMWFISVGAVVLFMILAWLMARSGSRAAGSAQLRGLQAHSEADFTNRINWLSREFPAEIEVLMRLRSTDSDRFSTGVDALGKRLLHMTRLPPEIPRSRADHLARMGILARIEECKRASVLQSESMRKAIAEAERATSAEQAIKALVDKYEDVLVRKIRQLVVRDDYGREVTKRWDQELDFFVDEIVRDEAADAYFDLYLDGSSERRARCKAIIDAAVRAAEQESREDGHRPYDESMSPIEFEHFCAEELRFSGWDARVTQASGDQGVDIVASMEGARMVVQCKLYSHPVGNDAVQQAYAGMVHEGADVACVVSNQPFTRAARELAATTGVQLLHHSDLRYARLVRGSDESTADPRKVSPPLADEPE